MADEEQQRVAGGQRAVEVESVDSHILQVNDYQEGQEPTEDDELGGTVAQDDLRGVAALLVDDGNLDVAQQADEDEDGGEVEVVRAEVGRDLGRDGVHDVADERDGAGDGDGLVDERQVVARGVAARCLTGVLHAKHIVAALGKGEEQREQERHEHNPLRERGARGQTTGENAQDEAESHDADIEDGVVLELGTVGEVQEPVEKDDGSLTPAPSPKGEGSRWPYQKGQEADGQHGEDEEQGHERVGLTLRDESGGDGALALYGVAAVGLDVDEVVEAIDAAGGEAEGQKREEGRDEALRVEQTTPEEQRQEDEEVLDPLLGSDEAEERGHF